MKLKFVLVPLVVLGFTVGSYADGENISIIDGLKYENQSFIKEYTWKKAVTHCERMKLGGYNNWRLPRKDELEKLLTEDKNRGYYIQKKFANNINGEKYAFFWTSTEAKKNSSEVWYISMKSGSGGWSDKTNGCYVMCVSK